MTAADGPSLASRATTLDFIVEESQADFESRLYETILARNGSNVDVLRQLVDIMAGRGDYQRALELDQRLALLRPKDCYVRYNLACSLSMLGHIVSALKSLDEALCMGYDDFVHMDADSDLDAARQHPGYYRLLEKHGLAG